MRGLWPWQRQLQGLPVHERLFYFAPAMSVATPTLIPRPEDFPHLLPKPPQPHPTPLPKAGGPSVRFNVRRNLQREMDDLSDEENELEDLVSCPYLISYVRENNQRDVLMILRRT